MRAVQACDLSVFVVASCVFAACASARHATNAEGSTDNAAPAAPSAAAAKGAARKRAPLWAAPVAQPKGAMNLEQARRYVLALVNRDRAENGLPAVALD